MNESASQKHFNPESFHRPITPKKMNGLLINPEFEGFLSRLGFHDFQRVFDFSGGEVFKDIPERTVTRIDVAPDMDVGARGATTLYLKRHKAERIKSKSGLTGVGEKAVSKSQGLVEFDNILAFRNEGLATVTPVAAGQKRLDDSRVISFILTEDFSPLVSLEWLQFNRPEFFTQDGAGTRKKALLRSIGEYARKMHQAGFNHKDFNATHILLPDSVSDPDFSDKPIIALFDLQRVDRKNLLRFRWIIKSLAELNYTLLDNFFTASDRRYLFLSFKGVEETGLYGRFQQWWIRRKTVRIARHTKNIMRRKHAGK